MRRGEVRWYQFSKPDKQRPVLILTRNTALEFLGEVTVAPLTSKIREIPSEVILTPDDGIPRDSAVNLDHIQTVPKNRLGAMIATLGAQRMAAVEDALRFALGFGTH